jgi:hypothetical protein
MDIKKDKMTNNIIYLKFTNATKDGFNTNYKELDIAEKYKNNKNAVVTTSSWYGVDSIHIKSVTVKYSELIKNKWIDDLKYKCDKTKHHSKLKEEDDKRT